MVNTAPATAASAAITLMMPEARASPKMPSRPAISARTAAAAARPMPTWAPEPETRPRDPTSPQPRPAKSASVFSSSIVCLDSINYFVLTAQKYNNIHKKS